MIDVSTKRQVRTRAQKQCEYCHIQQDRELLPHHVEHIIPRQHLGTDNEDNLALACYYCNAHKGTNLTAYDPIDGSLQVLYHPRLQEWEHHFRIDYGVVTGLTAVGRTTVRLLCMNDEIRVETRR